MKIREQVALCLEVEVEESCFLHLTRKSRFIQYVLEIVQNRDSSVQIFTKKTFCRKLVSGTCRKLASYTLKVRHKYP